MQKKIPKEIFSVLKNIEIICFINRDKLIDYQKFLSNNLEKNDKYKKLSTYLNNYWFKKSKKNIIFLNLLINIGTINKNYINYI